MKYKPMPPRILRQPCVTVSSKRGASFLTAACYSIALCCLLLSPLIMAPASAQTDFEIQAQKPELEQEYQAELDKWMLRAYEGDRDAQFKVGVLFTNSQFNKPDYEQAVYWYKQAARQGHVLAQYNLGHQYLTGVGVAESQKTAMQWWLKAAEQGHALAQFNIGRAYYLGIGLPEDHQTARVWFERAAANNEPKSIDILQQLGWTDGPDQVAITTPQADATSEALDQEEPSEPLTTEETSLTSVITAVDLDAEPEVKLEPKPEQPAKAATAILQPIADNALQSSVGPAEAPSMLADAAPADPAEAPSINQTKQVAPDADTQIEQSEATPADNAPAFPIALYTNPGVRAVLIAIIDERENIEVERESGEWSIVSSKVGFPVWVHGDFILVDGEIGKVTGTGVNARSVPIVTNGTVVGKLKKEEWLEVVDERDDWFRVLAPPRFVAWVKTSELDRQKVVAQQALEKKPTPKPTAVLTGPRPINDNDWLFSQAPDTYTLQLASFDDPVKIAEFESRAKFSNNPDLHRFTAKSKDKGIVWTYYLYGSYADTKAAQSAKLEINQKLAWIRNFGQLQQNRCVAWKTQLPTPKELNSYCTG